MRRECRERFPHHWLQRKPLVSDSGMPHVPWCMSRSLTRGGGENVPGIPGACVTRNFRYLVRGPWQGICCSAQSQVLLAPHNVTLQEAMDGSLRHLDVKMGKLKWGINIYITRYYAMRDIPHAVLIKRQWWNFSALDLLLCASIGFVECIISLCSKSVKFSLWCL